MTEMIECGILLDMARRFDGLGSRLDAVENGVLEESGSSHRVTWIENLEEVAEIYQFRYDRWERGEGPQLEGGQGFVEALRSSVGRVGLVVVKGPLASWMFLIDGSKENLLALLTVHDNL